VNAPVISLATYSIQTHLASDARGTLARLADAGFTRLEVTYGSITADVQSAMDEFGFGAPTIHLPFSSSHLSFPDGSSFEIPDPGESFRELASTDVRLVVDPFTSPQEWRTEPSVAAVAARINARAQEAAALGLRVAYHNHDHEIATRFGGRTALEVLVDHLDPAVCVELDLFWAAWGGADVPELVATLGERVVAVHVKDGLLGGSDPTTCQTPAGLGDVPLAESLDAAEHLEFAIIEFDQPRSGDAVADCIGSREFLMEYGFR
jgi:sugar phosphate isomerase/epimerase